MHRPGRALSIVWLARGLLVASAPACDVGSLDIRFDAPPAEVGRDVTRDTPTDAAALDVAAPWASDAPAVPDSSPSDVACAAGCGGKCVEGRCLSELGSGPHRPGKIAVDSDSVYWIDADNAAGTVMKAPLAGGMPVPLASGQKLPSGLAVDAKSVYWSTTFGGTLMSVPRAGGMSLTLAPQETSAAAVAVDGASIYWVSAAGLRKASLGGGAPALVAGGPYPQSLAINGGNLYWVQRAFDAKTKSDICAAMTVPTMGGKPFTLFSGNGVCGPGVAVDATGVYWTVGEAVMKVPLGGGTPTVLVEKGGDQGRDIAVDATSVYWLVSSAVMKVSLAGGAPARIAPANLAAALAVDATSVYWTEGFPGTTVKKLTPK